MQKLKTKGFFAKIQDVTTQWSIRLLFSVAVSAVALLCAEWIHRGALTADFFKNNFMLHVPAYLCSGLLLWCVYAIVESITHLPPLAVAVTGGISCVPAIVTYFKLKLRGEPFFPWDFSQVSEAADVMGQAGLEIQPSMMYTLLIFVLLCVVSWLFRSPKRGIITALVQTTALAAAGGALVFGVFLSPTGSQLIGIVPDMWMQNRYYRNYGVIAGFLTNIQTLAVNEPASYSQDTVQTLLDSAANKKPAFASSYNRPAHKEAVTQPNIIFVMNESFWDASELEDYGFAFDAPVTPNLQRLRTEAAYGKAYSPSFGGGTCDVEFEALTGFSVEFLPSGSKPFQQHVTKPMLSIASWLKEQGYSTQAIHGYYRKFWSRNTAYPYLGIDEFIALEDFVNPEKKRDVYWSGGLISDGEMARRMIEEWETRDTSKPLFMHAVTMQNHTSYNAANYPEDELVQITQHPAGISEGTISALQDFATGVREADEMLGTLTDYFSRVEEPTILVFWGDHYNPIGSGYEVYTASGYAKTGDSEDPALHKMPLLIWSNYHDSAIDLGTIATYEISPVVMDLYDLQRPDFYRYLTNQLSSYRGHTHGVTIQPDSTTTTDELTQPQQEWFQNHWMLQYDLMFGSEWANPIKKEQ